VTGRKKNQFLFTGKSNKNLFFQILFKNKRSFLDPVQKQFIVTGSISVKFKAYWY
jgi:hypothetical protein